VAAADKAVDVSFSYWTSSMSEWQAENLAGTFAKVLHSVLETGDREISGLASFSARDAHQVIEWNKVVPETINECVHDVVTQQVLKQPDAPAVCAWDDNFSYCELDELSAQLAQHLIDLNVKPEVLVPLCFEKSAWTIVAMLSVMKAGGACVPMDPSHSISRQEGIIHDVDAKVVLVGPGSLKALLGIVPHIIVVDRAFFQSLPVTGKSPAVFARPSNPAFVIYTSGSTGKPKGVVLEHASIATSVNAHGSVLKIGPGSRVLQFAAYVFDVSIQDIFTTLMRGGCVCVPSEKERMNDLAAVINKMNVNYACLTTTVANLLQPSDVPGLKNLSFLGEKVTKKTIEIWGGIDNLHNTYGPAECTICCSWNGNVAHTGSPSNVGLGLASLLWVVIPNDHNQLAPVGCVGELLVEGPLLSRGYLNDPEKTSASFIADPAWTDNNGYGKPRRMYKTGDLVRYNHDGTLEYLGRKDTQVKIHGQRLELGEVEHHVKLNLPGVSQVVVELVATKSQSENKALAAFICFTEGLHANDESTALALPTSAELQHRIIGLEALLTKSIPSHMVPSLFIPLHRIPMNLSGKTDRGRLRRLVGESSEEDLLLYALANAEKRAPTTDMEKALQGLWAAVLNVEPNSIGGDDSFFRLGGDSIAVMRLVALARERDVSLTAADIFHLPILAEMATLAVPSINNGDSHKLEPFALLGELDLPNLIQEVATKYDIDRDTIQNIYPCTALQEGLIALSNAQPGAYINQMVFRLPKSLGLSRFRNAWSIVVDVTEILRSRIIYNETLGSLQTVIKEKIQWLTANTLAGYIEEDKRIPMEYGRSLARYAIIGEGTSECYFVWTAHHAVYDAWSTSLVLANLERAYESDRTYLSAPFSRFISYLANVDVIASDVFWRAQLDGAPPLSFPGSASLQGSRMDATLTHQMQLPRKLGSSTTMSTVIRAAWAIVMARYSNADDTVFGATLTGRNAAVVDISNMIGPTITTVPIRVRLDWSQTVDSFLADVQDQATDMIPFEHAGLQHIKKLSSDAQGACNFQNLLVIQPADNSKALSSTIGLDQVSGGGMGFHTYALVVECILHNGIMDAIADFDERVISRVQMQRILRQFEHAVSQLNDGAGKVIGDVDLFSPQDEIDVRTWNLQYPDNINACIQDVIAKQLIVQPDAQAVCAWDADFTYAELDDISTRLACHLIQLGVGPEIMVPLCFEKSAWTIVAMLAVLKAGGVFVPLDPSHPLNRLSEIIQDVNAPLVLSSLQHLKVCDGLVDNIVVVGPLTRKLPKISELPSTNLDGSNAAYVIFTSGTTGKPKGTVVEHATYCTASTAHGKTMLMDSSTRVLQFASYSYDASLVEILTALMHGACVCVPNEETRMNDAVGFINASKANWALLTPSFMTTIDPASVPGLKVLLLGGEAMSQRHVAAWAEKVTLFNAYGPSECAVIAAMNRVTSAGAQPGNIGHGVGGLCWVVDSNDHNRLAPVGCVGELLMEGPLLARGYLNSPEKTAAAFIKDPAWAKSVGSSSFRRMYKTGDLVRYNCDGTLEYLGRKDTQVKLHAQRLELGDVEHHLQSNDEIRNSMATVPAEGHYKQRLVALIELEGSGPVATTSDDSSQLQSRTELRVVNYRSKELSGLQVSHVQKYLSSQLPSYMVPTVWIVVESIPLNTSGKLDRGYVSRWLHEIDEESYKHVDNAEEEDETEGGPTTEMDRCIQEVLGRVLNLPVERIALSRSFLSLGGDSITAMQAVSRARAEGIALRVQDFLQSHSISELVLLAKPTSQSSVSRIDELDTVFSLSPVQQMYFQMAGQMVNQFNQSFFLRLTRTVLAHEVVQAVEALVRQHSMLRSRFAKSEDGQWAQRITKDIAGSFRFRLHQIVDPKEIRTIVTSSQASLDVESGPVFAADMFNVEGDGQFLFLVAHHLLIDLVSWRIVLQDLEEILQSGALSAATPFPFQAWCKLQAEHAQQLVPGKVLPFDIAPADHAYWGMEDRPDVYGDAITESFTIDADMTLTLLGSCHDALRTEPVDLFMATLLQAFSQIFPDRVRPTLFSEGHGREPCDADLDLSGTVGWFTTMSPLHVPVFDNADVVDTVRRTKDIRHSLPGNGWPYFTSRFLNPEGIEAFKGHWQMELLFNYLGRYQQLERADGLFRQEAIPGEVPVSDVGLDVQRLALFEVSVVVIHGVAQFSVLYNRGIQRQADISHWMLAWKHSLLKAANQLSSMEVDYTLSDFPLLSLTYDGLNKLKTERLPGIGVDSFTEVEDIYPCSPMQQGILLSQTRNSGSYDVAFTFEVVPSTARGPVDADRLSLAWQHVVDRHAAMRTVFMDSVSENGLFDQIVLKHISTIAVTKLSARTDADAINMLSEQRSVNHDQARPPHQLTLSQAEESGRLFCKLEISHAVMDAASLLILLGDFNLAYDGRLPPGSGPLYSDYIRYLSDRPIHLAVDFWKQRLSGIEPCHIPLLSNGLDQKRELRYVSLDLCLKDNALQSFCEKNSVTVANLAQTVWGLVLRSYTGSDQVCFGYLSSGRDIEVDGIDEAVGPFINMLVCYMAIDRASSPAQLVKQVLADYLAGLEHQHCSLAQVQHGLNLVGRPLFNTLMSVQRLGTDQGVEPAISFNSIGGHDPTEVSDRCHNDRCKFSVANTNSSTILPSTSNLTLVIEMS
jgi:amino acid adenylation domain-containing protein/non-ribosomal peptide synthase protein (TIGR01720 family)